MRDRSDRLTEDQVAAYLARIDVTSEGAPAVDHLRELQLQHLRAVPFENLSIHLAEPISLALDHLFGKIVVDRRGGFCYELNGLFSPTGYAFTGGGTPTALLRTLGYDVDLFAGAVGPRLADVGFGRHSAYPQLLDEPGEQLDPSGQFRIDALPGGDLDVCLAGRPQYRVEPRPRELSDFEPTCWWQQTRPGSHFRAGPVCSILTPSGGLLTLAGRQLISTEQGERTETALASDAEVLAAYRERFGVRLPRVPVPVEGDQRRASS
ncbi:MAG: arylamine N-acetyltransferase family protein [Jatrophihabitantaceae bacterium]